MADNLDEFTVYERPDTVVPTAEFEGTNASRFAIAATLGAGAQDSDLRPLDIVPSINFERFGFNPEIALLRAEGASAEQGYVEARTFIDIYGDGWSPEEVRVRAWRDLNERGELTARFAFLLGGMCSVLERESVTAAVAIINSVPSVTSTTPARVLRRGPWFGQPWADPFFSGGPLPWSAVAADEDGVPEVLAEWQGEDWADFSNYWVRNAIRFGGVRELLGAVGLLARWRIELGLRSADPIVRELAMASYLIPSEDTSAPPFGPDEPLNSSGHELISTMVHGTWGWKGDWWYSGGDFHGYIRGGYRNRLYEGGMEFSWSGAYSKRQRTLGGERFKRWVDSAGGAEGLGSVFAHSYGGEIVARAVNAGALIDEVVLLSAPIHDHHVAMCERVRRVVDVRLQNDIVLVLARARQSLPMRANVVPHIIERSLWSHSASHEPEVWRGEGIAAKVAL